VKGRNEMSFLRRARRIGENAGAGIALASALVATALAATSASAEVVNYTDKWACPTFVDRLIMSFACASGKPVRT